MYFSAISITESDSPCNCPWMECPEHKESLCQHHAATLDRCLDPECKSTHFVGDGTLGDGIHLCMPCVDGVFDFLVTELTRFMRDFSEFVPKEVAPLEQLLIEYYIRKLNNPGWLNPLRDAHAVLCFAHTVLVYTYYHQSEKQIPVDIVLRLSELTQKMHGIREAFAT